MPTENELVLSSKVDLSGLLEFSNNPFERTVQMKELRTSLMNIVNQLDDVLKYAYEDLSAIDDENYAVEPVFDSRKTSTLDADLFAQELPDNYANSLYMKTSDIVKLIGRDKLKQLVIDTVGWEVFEENATINITDARKNIPKPMQDRYISEEYKQVDYIIVRKHGEK